MIRSKKPVSATFAALRLARMFWSRRPTPRNAALRPFGVQWSGSGEFAREAHRQGRRRHGDVQALMQTNYASATINADRGQRRFHKLA